MRDTSRSASASAVLDLRNQALALAEQLNNEARTRLAALQEVKRQSLSERQAELDLVRDAAAKIAKNVEEQVDLLARLEREVSEREAGAKSGGR